MSKHRLDPLMNPRSVAYVGASETPDSPGYRLIQVAKAADYKGTIWGCPATARLASYPPHPTSRS